MAQIFTFRNETRSRSLDIGIPNMNAQKRLLVSQIPPQDKLDEAIFIVARQLRGKQYTCFLHCYANDEVTPDRNAKRGRDRILLLIEKKAEILRDFKRAVAPLNDDGKGI